MFQRFGLIYIKSCSFAFAAFCGFVFHQLKIQLPECRNAEITRIVNKVEHLKCQMCNRTRATTQQPDIKAWSARVYMPKLVPYCKIQFSIVSAIAIFCIFYAIQTPKTVMCHTSLEC